MNQSEKQKNNKKIKHSMTVRILLLAGLLLLPFTLYAAMQSPAEWLKMILFSVILILMAVIAFLG